MRPIGYLYKHVASCPEWLAAPRVKDIYSLSGHISENFAEYIGYWKHNGFWLFDSPAIMQALSHEQEISLEGLTLFYYEAYELQYDQQQRIWLPFEPEASLATDVQPPGAATFEGFDVVNFTAGTSPECSMLSCNRLADDVQTNAHCLIGTFDAAKHAIESGVFEHAEPGPYRIIGVYSVEKDLSAASNQQTAISNKQ